MKPHRVLLRTILYLHSRLERGLKSVDAPISLSQYRLLFMIQEGPARSVDLAVASGLTKPSVSSQIALMLEQGWIERNEIADDKRASSIQITRTGCEVLEAFETHLNDVLSSFLGKRVVDRANKDLLWLFGRWNEKRDAAHAAWADRGVTATGSAAPGSKAG